MGNLYSYVYMHPLRKKYISKCPKSSNIISHDHPHILCSQHNFVKRWLVRKDKFWYYKMNLNKSFICLFYTCRTTVFFSKKIVFEYKYLDLPRHLYLVFFTFLKYFLIIRSSTPTRQNIVFVDCSSE